MPILNYDGYAFTNRIDMNGTHQLHVRWNQIVHAAATVGRRGWRDVFKHGRYSIFEIFYRCCMIYANLQTSSSNRIVKTNAYNDLDQSEKSAISYFLGLTFTKLMATTRFSILWLMHLDTYKNQMSILTGRRRPDLVGQDGQGKWIVFEAKGRTNGKEPGLATKAKDQTRGLRTIANCRPYLRIASIVHFPSSPPTLHVYMEDPDDIEEDAIDLSISENQFYQDYYRPIINIIEAERSIVSEMPTLRRIRTVDVDGIERRIHTVELLGTDVEIGLENQVYKVLRSRNIRSQISEIMPPILEPLAGLDTEDFQPRYTGPDGPTKGGENDSFLGPDGVFVRLGESWSTKRMRLDPEERL